MSIKVKQDQVKFQVTYTASLSSAGSKGNFRKVEGRVGRAGMPKSNCATWRVLSARILALKRSFSRNSSGFAKNILSPSSLRRGPAVDDKPAMLLAVEGMQILKYVCQPECL